MCKCVLLLFHFFQSLDCGQAEVYIIQIYKTQQPNTDEGRKTKHTSLTLGNNGKAIDISHLALSNPR